MATTWQKIKSDPILLYVFLVHVLLEAVGTAVVFGFVLYVYPPVYDAIIPIQAWQDEYQARTFAAVMIPFGGLFVTSFFHALRTPMKSYDGFRRVALFLTIADAFYSLASIIHLSQDPTLNIMIPAYFDLFFLVSKVVLFGCDMARENFMKFAPVLMPIYARN